MSTTIRTEKRQRSVFGQLVKWVFIAFNLLMLLWLVSAIGAISQMTPGSDAERVGAAIGATMGFSMLLSIWVMGDLILGIFVLLTRGNTVIVEERVGGSGGQESSFQTMDPDAAVARYIQQKNAEAKQQEHVRTGSTAAQPGFGRRSR